MTFQSLSRTVAFGIVLAAAGPALADSHGDAGHHFLNAPGIGVPADIGNSRAADVPMFHTGERPKSLWIYDVDTGEYVARERSADKTRGIEVQGPEIDFGLDVS